MNSNYITSVERTARQKPAFVKIILAAIIATFIGLSGTLAAFSKEDKSAEAFDAVQWAMCYFGEDSMPGIVYQTAQSSDLQFALRSKSSITGGVDNVDAGLNGILDMFGPGFKEVNESITGYSLEPFEPEAAEGAPAAEDRFNKGAKVNPFDRFGVAGMKFTAYTGEWKHVVINACDPGAAPQDPKAGVFYDGRLEARSTWEDIDNSRDIRTMQFGKGFNSQFAVSMADLFANGIFTITKAIVVMTVGLINFAFSDIVEIMGFNEMLAGGDGGIFGLLFDGIFTPLIVIVFVLTGGYIFWNGLVKRQYRSSMTALLRSLALFIIAIIIAAAPMTYITLPNKIAVVGQSIIITTMNSSLAGGNGLCSTNIGQFETKIVNNPNAEPQDVLTDASQSMRSAIGCQFWQTFLMKPYVQGQYGTDWEKLYAKGKIPDWAPSSISADLQNENESMVGDAAVPMGDGEFIHNWALFQISTQTNAHAPIGHVGEKSKYTAGVANDWWRIVDVMANYQEEEVSVDATGGGPNGITNSVTYTTPKDSAISPYWHNWTGNSAYSRIWTASSSVIVAGIGMAAPLFFAFLSAVYSFGIAILMAFAPIMFLLGCWAGRGWEMFKGWGELVVNTTLKRIVTGGLLAIVIGLEAAAIKMMDTMGWWQGILMMILVSLIMIKSRHKIIDSLASVKFASTNFGATAAKMNNKTMGAVKTVGKTATSSVVAGVASKRYGGNFRDGMISGVKTELRQAAYQSRTLMNGMTAYEQEKRNQGHSVRGHEACVFCGKEIKFEEDQYGMQVQHGARTADGNAMCYECYADGMDPDALEFVVNQSDIDAVADERNKKKYEEGVNNSILNKQQEELRARRFSGKTAFGNSTAQDMLEKIQKGVNDKGVELSPESTTKLLQKVMKSVQYDINSYKRENGMPAIPTEIQDSINHDLMAEAWRTGNFDWIRQAYAAAWANWFVETTGNALNCKLEDLVESMNSDGK